MSAIYGCAPLPEPYGWAVRFSVAWTCVSLLSVKQACCDRPQRPTRDFVCDTSKQMIGLAWSWFLWTPSVSCATYLSTTLLEATVGVIVQYFVLAFLLRMLKGGTGNKEAFVTGKYDGKNGRFSVRFYVMQLVLWIICVTMTCNFVAFLQDSYHADVITAKVLMLDWWNSKVKVLFAMLITPCFARGFQVCITDDFLKGAGGPALLQMLFSNLRRRQARATRSQSGGVPSNRPAVAAKEAPPAVAVKEAPPQHAPLAVDPTRKQTPPEAQTRLPPLKIQGSGAASSNASAPQPPASGSSAVLPKAAILEGSPPSVTKALTPSKQVSNVHKPLKESPEPGSAPSQFTADAPLETVDERGEIFRDQSLYSALSAFSAIKDADKAEYFRERGKDKTIT